MTYIPNPTWVDGKDGTLITADALNHIESGIQSAAAKGLVGMGVPDGRYFQLTRSANASGTFGAVLGTEYAVGIELPSMTLAALKILVNAVGAEGTSFRIGLRPVTTTGFGAPLLDVAMPVDSTGNKTVTFTPVSIPAGPYALSWVRSNDTTNTLRLQRSVFDQNPWLFSLASGVGTTAAGHGPVHAILNTGVTGELPASVVVGSVGTNLEGGMVPNIEVRKA